MGKSGARGGVQDPHPAGADPSPCPVLIHSEHNRIQCFSHVATQHQHFSGKSFLHVRHARASVCEEIEKIWET